MLLRRLMTVSLLLAMIVFPLPGGDAALAQGKSRGKVFICHATGSQTSPFVLIRVSVSAQKAHEAHQGDVVIGAALPADFTVEDCAAVQSPPEKIDDGQDNKIPDNCFVTEDG